MVAFCGESPGGDFVNVLDNTNVFTGWITFTRSRAYRKNDNCYVEQKNYSVVRRFLGYSRYDTDKELFLVREILKLVEVYVNFFQPSVKLISKTRINNKCKKNWDTAKTPHRRLLESGILNQSSKDNLNQIYHSLNPMELRRKISQLNQKLNQVNRYKLVESTNS